MLHLFWSKTPLLVIETTGLLGPPLLLFWTLLRALPGLYCSGLGHRYAREPSWLGILFGLSKAKGQAISCGDVPVGGGAITKCRGAITRCRGAIGRLVLGCGARATLRCTNRTDEHSPALFLCFVQKMVELARVFLQNVRKFSRQAKICGTTE